MANPVPCGICQQVDAAEFLVTDLTPEFQLLGRPTSGVCVGCWISLGDAIRKALEDTSEESAPEQPVGTGVLEQIEQAEGVVSPSPSPARSSKRKKADPEANGQADAPEAETSHVDS